MDDHLVTTDAALVESLVRLQHPDLGDRSVTFLASGWDNDTYRMGSDLIARLPRRTASADLLANEQRWLPEFAPDLPLPIPVPVRLGGPALDYPFAWSICAWLPGDIAATAQLGDSSAEPRRLGEFLGALHIPAPAALAPNPYRGVGLEVRRPILEQNLTALDSTLSDGILDAFDQLAATPPWAGPPLRLHGDLHSANVLVNEGQVSAIIDWGDVCSGDPACDLAIAWMLFDGSNRDTFRHAAGCDDDTWDRAAAWALAFGAVYVANESLSERMATIGRQLLAEVMTTIA